MTRNALKGLLLALALTAGAAPALAQGTAFTYQGELQSSGAPVNSPADFQFSLFSAATGGTQVGSTVTRNAQSVAEGLFTTAVDFGVNPFTSNQTLFLQIAVRSPAGSGSFVTMNSRQPLTPAPFSLSTRGLNVDAAGNITLPRDANRTLSVGQEPVGVPGGSNGRSLTIASGSAATGASSASLGGNLILQAGSGFNNTQPNVSGGDTIIRSGANATSANDGRNGGAIILQSGAQNNTFVERMRITPTGNVGIGSAAPLAKFEVADGTGSDTTRWGTFQINRPDNVTGSHIAFLRTGLNVMGLGYGAAGSNVFGFGTGNTGTGFVANRLSINNDTGNVGIGSTSPSRRLTVAGGLQVDEGSANNGASAPGGFLNSNTLLFGSSSSGEGIGSTRVAGGANQNGLDFFTGYTRRVSIAGNGNVGIGTAAPQFMLDVNGEAAVKCLTIKGGCDLVEGFDSKAKDIEPGMLMVIDTDRPGMLLPSTDAYDTKVAGIVSGAGGINPGLKLSQEGVLDGEHLITMTGRVYVKATSINGAIKPGDRLTTSTIPGHAMKATDAVLADGAVVGKAMTGLDKDTGLVLVLVNLQ
jgi:hypothetical protein